MARDLEIASNFQPTIDQLALDGVAPLDDIPLVAIAHVWTETVSDIIETIGRDDFVVGVALLKFEKLPPVSCEHWKESFLRFLPLRGLARTYKCYAK